MNKTLKITLIVIVSLVALGFGGYQYLMYQTKQQSPEESISYNNGDYGIDVFYNRPSKNGREIFGGLVPFNEVWRTGANEATTFTTKSDLIIDGKKLAAGEYTLWTIPNADSWKVIFNSKQYSWGVSNNGKASREPEFDVLTVEVAVEASASTIERFTISFDEKANQPTLYLSWDQTKVSIALQ